MKYPVILAVLTFLSSAGISQAMNGNLEGFGNDVDLSVAVRQIVPQNYAVSYGTGVDLYAPTEWKGGHHWRSVLAEVAEKNSLNIIFESNNMIKIEKSFTVRDGGAGFVFIGKDSQQNRQNRNKMIVVDNIQKTPVQMSIDNTPTQLIVDKPVVDKPVVDRYVTQKMIDDHNRRKEAKKMKKNHLKPATMMDPKNLNPKSLSVGNPVKTSNGDVMKISSSSHWNVEKGDTLFVVLENWAKTVDWTVIWQSGYSYPIIADASFSGSFVEASSKLIKSLSNVSPVIYGSYYKGNKVLVMENTKGIVN